MTRPANPPGDTASPPIRIEVPTVADGAAMWRLVEDLDHLEGNSLYTYLLLARDFAPACRVAWMGDRVVGLVTGYRPPHAPDTYFVWQVGVHPDARRRGLASRLIGSVLDAPGNPPRWLEATVTPDNAASRRLFRGIAEQRGVECRIEPGFLAEHFGGETHEPEERFRIGPFRRNP